MVAHASGLVGLTPAGQPPCLAGVFNNHYIGFFYICMFLL